MAEYIDRLRELAEADKAGRLVVLPCKVGDTVYMPVGRRNTANQSKMFEWQSWDLRSAWENCVSNPRGSR